MTKTARKLYRCLGGAALAALLLMAGLTSVHAQPGTLLGTVTLPGQVSTNVGGGLVPTATVASGVVYVTTQSGYTTLLVYEPPVGGNGAGTLVGTKTLVDAGNSPVTVTCVAWDPVRSVLWGAHGQSGNVYTIALGNPTVNGNALTTFEFNIGASSFFCDGIAYDGGADTIWVTFDVSTTVREFGLGPPSGNALGALLSTVTPLNAAGAADGSISGVVVGTANSLYIGRNGAAEIRRVDKSTGTFITQFATTSGRVEDLTCDPVTYAPLEAVLAKDAFGGFYEAFEVDNGTCPLPGAGECDPRTQGYWHRQCLGIDAPEGIDPGRNGRGPTGVLEPDFEALIASVETELQASIAFFGFACGEGMDADPPRDPAERAIKQYTALLFNVESNRLQCGDIDVSLAGCASTNVEDLLDEIAELINAGEFKQAAHCAAFANEGF